MWSWASIAIFCFLISVLTATVPEIDMFLEPPNADVKFLKEKRRLTYLDAHKNCLAKGGRLAVIKSTTDMSLMTKANLNKEASYIGLTDMKIEGGFIWGNGAIFQAYNHLRFSPPNPDNYMNREHCVTSQTTRISLNDIVCNAHLPSICQIHPNLAHSKSTVFGAIFNGPASGALKIEFKPNNIMEIRGMVGSVDRKMAITVMLLHDQTSGSPLCTNPVPLFEIYRKYKYNLRAKLAMPNYFGGRHVISISIPDIKDSAPSHYGIAVRINSNYAEHLDCSNVRIYSAMQWYNSIADVDYKFANEK